MAFVSKDTRGLLKELLAIDPLVKGDPDINVVRRTYDEVFAKWTAPAMAPTREDWIEGSGLPGKDKTLVVEPAGGKPPLANLIFLHGGGWMLGSPLAYAPLCRWISAYTGFRVLAPDYPLAPERPAPAATEALTSFMKWVAQTYPEFILLAGDSAGGQLAAVLSNRPPEGITVKAQALLYPVLDLRLDAEYKSRKKNGSGKYFLSNDAIVGASAAYCANDIGLAGSPEHTPMLETDFSKTPPTYLLAPELDPLFDETHAYADLLKQNGVTIQINVARGSIHGCVSFSSRLSEGMRTLKSSCDFLLKHTRR